MKRKLRSYAIILIAMISVVTFSQDFFAQTQRNPVLEEFTGTWCQWCPCGHTVMAQILASMPNAIMIGYHGPANSSDPWDDFPGNQVVALLSPPYWPSGTVDRTGAPNDRGIWASWMNQRYTVPATVSITMDKSFNEVTRELNAEIQVTTLENLTGEYKLSFLLLEDGLIYTQAGNGSCPAGSNYVHHHVVRAMINGATGETLNGANPWNLGETITKNILYTVPSVVIPDSCELVALVYKVVSPLYNGTIQQGEKWDLVSPATFQLTVSIANGWNLVSIPGLNSPDQNVTTWWPGLDPVASVYKFSGGYQPVTTATPTEGYWLKNLGTQTYNTGDEWPAGGIQIVPHDPIIAASGWNLIGGYENTVATSGLTTTPPGLIDGSVYKYTGGYQIATSLDPGYGYWIKLSGAGQIILPNTLSKGELEVNYFPEDWGKIVLTDATGLSYTLYAVKGNVDLNQYELPPTPPDGMFDMRFSSGRIAEDINSSLKAIELSGVTYPLTVRTEGMDIRLMDESGKTINVNLKSGEDVVISDATIQKLMVTGELIPAAYALEQNYPNPFNPSTW